MDNDNIKGYKFFRKFREILLHSEEMLRIIHKVTMLISYIIIGLTDYFDGKIARRLNQTTDPGKTLDSVADLFFYVSSAFFKCGKELRERVDIE